MGAQDLVISATMFAHAHDNVGRRFTATWNKLAERLSRHDEGAKDGPALTVATFNGLRGNATLVSRSLIALDVERNKITGECPPDPRDIESILRTKRLAATIYTTHSNTPDDTRYRVFFPLSQAIPLPDADAVAADMFAVPTVSAQIGLAGVVDKSKFGASSLMFLPRHPRGSTAHYSAVLSGDPINTPELLAIAQMVSEKVATDEARIAEMRARNALPPEVLEIIDEFNSRHPLPEMLTKYGYRREGRGSRWKSRNQAGAGATTILPDGKTWVSFSGSDSDAGVGAKPLRASSQAACWGSAFDLMRQYEARGSFREALRLARQEISNA